MEKDEAIYELKEQVAFGQRAATCYNGFLKEYIAIQENVLFEKFKSGEDLEEIRAQLRVFEQNTTDVKQLILSGELAQKRITEL
jgi:hypothetical protein